MKERKDNLNDLFEMVHTQGDFLDVIVYLQRNMHLMDRIGMEYKEFFDENSNSCRCYTKEILRNAVLSDGYVEMFDYMICKLELLFLLDIIRETEKEIPSLDVRSLATRTLNLYNENDNSRKSGSQSMWDRFEETDKMIDEILARRRNLQ
jgi:hypothetical protein